MDMLHGLHQNQLEGSDSAEDLIDNTRHYVIHKEPGNESRKVG